MKNLIFNSGNYSRNINVALLLLRITIGVFMLTHGIVKLMWLMGDEPIMFLDPIGLGPKLSLILVVFAEVFCSIFLIIGFATRPSTIPLAFSMFVAIFLVHGIAEFKAIELALLYFLVYIFIAITGAGKYSIDSLIHAKLK